MEREILTVLLVLPLVVLLSCSPSTKNQQAKIAAMEKEMINKTKGTLDKDKALDLINAYRNYAKNNPQDTMSALYLVKMAELQLNAVSPIEAVNTLNRIIKDFPSFRKAPECLFLKGFIYENNLNDLNKARSTYQEFLQRYPNHYFAKDAKVLISNLGKSPEELVKEFEAKNAEAQPNKK